MKPDLLFLVVLKMVRWTLKYGVCNQSPIAFATYGMMKSSVFGDLKGGYDLGKVSLSLLDQLNDRVVVEARTKFLVHYGLSHWILPLPNTSEPLLEAYRIGLETGDIETAVFSIHWYCLAALNSGKPLSVVERDLHKYALQMKDQKQMYIYQAQCVSRQYTLNLLGKSDNPLLLTGEAWEERGGDHHMNMVEKTKRSRLAYCFGDFQDAWRFAEETPDLKKFSFGSSVIWRQSFSVGLVAFALAKKTGKRIWKKRAASFHKQIKKWYQAGNINCRHMLKIFDAERAVVRGKASEKVKKKYDEAIKTAGRSGCRQDSALANELAGEYYVYFASAPDTFWAKHYLGCALRLYEEWEAHAKVDQMKETYPEYLARAGNDPTGT